MSHTYSVYRIFTSLSLFLLLAISACKDKIDKNEVIFIDSLNSNINNQSDYNDDSISYTSLDNTLNIYSNKYKIVTDWSDYNKDNKSKANNDLKNKNLIFPVFKEQIKFLLQPNVTDTILIYSGNKSNSFVINITKGEDLFKKLNDRNNGIIIVHIEEVEYSQKLYLTKKYTDFQHKEKIVTEFYLKAELIEAINLGTKDDLLKEEFNLE